MPSAREALARLREGNRRFVAGAEDPAPSLSPDRRLALAQAQRPFAVILGCSDSRVPAELIFRQGFGDLFVIRVAGNVVAPSLIGSVEFAAERFGTRLVVVLGHTGCGAVTATVEALRHPAAEQSPGLRAIVDRIRPAVELLLAAPEAAAPGAAVPEATASGATGSEANGSETTGSEIASPDTLVARAVRANVRLSAGRLRRESAVLARLAEREGLAIVGAEYCLETGVVDFFEGVRDGDSGRAARDGAAAR